MKGIVFTVLNDMVVEKFGLDVWEQMLAAVNLSSGGAYTAGDTYPHEELVGLVTELSKISGIKVPDLIRAYGEYMFPVLAQKYPMFLGSGMKFKPFLNSIENVIHVEVKKLYPDAGLPTIQYDEPNSNQVILTYRSPRKLCYLAEGLITGAAKHFHENITLNQSECMHQGSDHCCIEIHINGAKHG